MDYVCPSCKSDNIQRLSVIYEAGLSDIEARTKGTAVGLSRGGISLGVGGGKTKGVSQTAASKRAAPPARMAYVKPLLAIFAAFLIVSMFIDGKSEIIKWVATGGWIVATAGWIYYTFHYNSKTWPPLKAAWDKSYVCNRCNEIFHLEL